MIFFAGTIKGNYEFLEKELKGRFGIICKDRILDTVTFESELNKAIEIAYLGQSIKEIGFLILKDKISGIKDVKKDFDKIIKEIDSKLSKIEFNFPKVKKIEKATVNVETNNNFLKKKINEIINIINNKVFKRKNIVLDFKEKRFIFNLKIESNNNEIHVLFGLNIFGYDLSKRTYRVFINKSGISPIVAFSLVLFSELKRDQKIVDFMCKDNTIMLEAYHYLANRSVRKFDKDELNGKSILNLDLIKNFEEIDKTEKEVNWLYATDMAFPNLDAARKNSKIAGVAKKINFAKKDLRFFDISFNFVFDKAISYINLSKHRKNLIVDKIEKFVLPIIKEMNIITNLPEEFENRDFNIIKCKKIQQGMLKLKMLKIINKNIKR